jgi:hypothetical protein
MRCFIRQAEPVEQDDAECVAAVVHPAAAFTGDLRLSYPSLPQRRRQAPAIDQYPAVIVEVRGTRRPNIRQWRGEVVVVADEQEIVGRKIGLECRSELATRSSATGRSNSGTADHGKRVRGMERIELADATAANIDY